MATSLRVRGATHVVMSSFPRCPSNAISKMLVACFGDVYRSPRRRVSHVREARAGVAQVAHQSCACPIPQNQSLAFVLLYTWHRRLGQGTLRTPDNLLYGQHSAVRMSTAFANVCLTDCNAVMLSRCCAGEAARIHRRHQARKERQRRSAPAGVGRGCAHARWVYLLCLVGCDTSSQLCLATEHADSRAEDLHAEVISHRHVSCIAS